MSSNYPPGVTGADIDDYMDPRVSCCGRRASNCECPQCPQCDKRVEDDGDFEPVTINAKEVYVCEECAEEIAEDEDDEA